MSAVITAFLSDYIPEGDIFKFVESSGGYVIKSEKPSPSIGVIEKGDATIWVYYGSNIAFFDSELTTIKESYGVEAKTVIQSELSSDEESNLIALNFCKSLLNKHPNSIVLENSFNKYYCNKELQKTQCTEDGLWISE